jgi:hypothetical protein
MTYQKNKVLIVTIPIIDADKPHPVMAILGSCCEKAEVDYDFYDLNLQMHKKHDATTLASLDADFRHSEFTNQENERLYRTLCKDLIGLIKKNGTTTLAISVFTKNSILSIQTLLDELQNSDVRDKITIVIGGVGIQSITPKITGEKEYAEYALEKNLIDFFIKGEGEYSFVEFLKGNYDYPGINKNNQRQITDLNVLPKPSYKKIQISDYVNERPEIVINGSRGCVRSCSFCDIDHFWKKYIYKDGSVIANEMYSIYQETGVLKFDFSDSLINGSNKGFRAMNKRLIELRNIDKSFVPLYSGQFICKPVGQMLEQDYADMKEAGAETITVGIESFSEKVRHHMKKKFNDDAVDFHFDQSAKYGINNAVLLLTGYVNEHDEDHQKNLDGLRKYQKLALTNIISAINIAITGLEITHNTPLWYEAHMNKRIILGDSPEEWINLDNPTLDFKERYRRGVEIVCTAVNLGYNVLHLKNYLAELRNKNYLTKSKLPIK